MVRKIIKGIFDVILTVADILRSNHNDKEE